MSYSGRDYYGLQHNPGDEDHVTIEWKLFEALVAAKVVYSNILQERKKCSYASCSRTDKGVRKSLIFSIYFGLKILIDFSISRSEYEMKLTQVPLVMLLH